MTPDERAARAALALVKAVAAGGRLNPDQAADVLSAMHVWERPWGVIDRVKLQSPALSAPKRVGRKPRPALRRKRAMIWHEASHMKETGALTPEQFKRVVAWVSLTDGGVTADHLANIASSPEGRAAGKNMTEEQRALLRLLIAKIMEIG